jgi:hypothetical protein
MLAHVVDAGAFSIGLALYIGALMRNTKGIFTPPAGNRFDRNHYGCAGHAYTDD